MAILKRVRFGLRSPLTIVEAIIAIASIISGIYVGSPLILYSAAVNGPTPLVAALGSPIALIFYGGLLVLSGAFMLAGIIMHRYRWRSNAIFFNMLLRFYQLIAMFLVQGLLPFTWIGNATVIAISLICYLVCRSMLFVRDDK